MNFSKAIEILIALAHMDDETVELMDKIIASKEEIDKLPSPFNKLDDLAVEFKAAIQVFQLLKNLFPK